MIIIICVSITRRPCFRSLKGTQFQAWIIFGGKVPEIKSQEEIDERDALMYRLEESYLEIPQRMPDQEWFHDLIEHYTKYNDYDGALDIWKWMDAHNIWINMDQDVIDKFDGFFERNDPKSLFQMSDHQAAHRLELLEKFKLMDNNPERWWKKREICHEKPERLCEKLPEGDRTNSGMGN